SRGRFLQTGWLLEIAQRVGIGRDSLSVGDAAAIFSIRDRTITISRGAINTSVLGLQGKGTVGFNGDADLDIIAAPLGDWRQHIEKSKIPIVGDVAGELAGGIQKLVNATSKYLYEFDVKGKVSSPKIRPIPAPALTNAAASVFGKMLQDVKSVDLLK